MKDACLIVLWVLLAYRVSTLIASYDGDKQFVLTLAFLAWTGGLVTKAIFDSSYRRRKL